MKPCNIGMQGICCKNCAMGPCRLPLPKGGIEEQQRRPQGALRRHGQHDRGPKLHPHDRRRSRGPLRSRPLRGRSLYESAAYKETEDYNIKDTNKLLEIAALLRCSHHS
jgi:carbon-monoxide dehydrogenase catalytic subunit